jgi:hypothetical protein
MATTERQSKTVPLSSRFSLSSWPIELPRVQRLAALLFSEIETASSPASQDRTTPSPPPRCPRGFRNPTSYPRFLTTKPAMKLLKKAPTPRHARIAPSRVLKRPVPFVSQSLYRLHASRSACRHLGRKQRDRFHRYRADRIEMALSTGGSPITLAVKLLPQNARRFRFQVAPKVLTG